MYAAVQCKAALHVLKSSGFHTVIDGGIGDYEFVYDGSASEPKCGIINIPPSESHNVKYYCDDDGVSLHVLLKDEQNKPVDSNFLLKVI